VVDARQVGEMEQLLTDIRDRAQLLVAVGTASRLEGEVVMIAADVAGPGRLAGHEQPAHEVEVRRIDHLLQARRQVAAGAVQAEIPGGRGLVARLRAGELGGDAPLGLGGVDQG
jgi:hypothetical protein